MRTLSRLSTPARCYARRCVRRCVRCCASCWHAVGTLLFARATQPVCVLCRYAFSVFSIRKTVNGYRASMARPVIKISIKRLSTRCELNCRIVSAIIERACDPLSDTNNTTLHACPISSPFAYSYITARTVHSTLPNCTLSTGKAERKAVH